jgi:DNA-binding transcriptional LysR family regulator
MTGLTHAAAHSRKTYPHTPLRLYVEALGGVVKPVLDGTCSIGIIGSLPSVAEELKSEPLVEVPFVTVVSPSHPLAGKRGVIPTAVLTKEVQLVLSDRTTLTEGRNYGVFSALTWRLADLGAKLEFLKSGLGWGHMPLHMVQADIDRGALVKIRVEGAPREFSMPMRIIYRKDAPPGPAGRTFIAQLKRGCSGKK